MKKRQISMHQQKGFVFLFSYRIIKICLFCQKPLTKPLKPCMLYNVNITAVNINNIIEYIIFSLIQSDGDTKDL